ncbi:MAG: hypothetical protein AABY22_06425, partial [Nanoarchaeota archaeon]
MKKEKVLLISNFLDNTGYSVAGQGLALALNTIPNIDLICRVLKLNDNKDYSDVPPEIFNLINKDSSDCSICIQHSLPHLCEPNYRFKKNIIYFAWETNNFIDSGWFLHLNLFDEIWVINPDQKDACLKSGVKKPIYVFPHAFDPEKYQNLDSLPPLDLPVNKDSFLF